MAKPEFIEIEFEDGIENFEIMGIFECKGREYIALLPEVYTEDYVYDIGDIYLCRYIQLEDGFELENIETEEEKLDVDEAFEIVFNEA